MKWEREWVRCGFEASTSWQNIFLFSLRDAGKQVKSDRKLIRLSISRLRRLSKIWFLTPNSYSILNSYELYDWVAFLQVLESWFFLSQILQIYLQWQLEQEQKFLLKEIYMTGLLLASFLAKGIRKCVCLCFWPKMSNFRIISRL